ncbi:hypothetical protein DEI87_12795, partial [Curtobacterium sp. MCBD17_029]
VFRAAGFAEPLAHVLTGLCTHRVPTHVLTAMPPGGDVDDLTFSGDDRLARRADAFLRGVDRIVTDQGLRLNARKTRVPPASVRQSVTGVVVNDRTAPGRREVDRLHAVLHNCAEHGPESQNRSGHPDFRAHLLGRIGWVSRPTPDEPTASARSSSASPGDRAPSPPA